MKTALFLSLFVVAMVSGSPLLGLGKSCDKYTIFVVTNFFVTPYPPPAGAVMNVTMSGTFSETAYVSDIAIKTSYNSGAQVVSYIDVGNTYTYGQIYTFAFPLTAGTAKGLYDVQVLLDKSQGKGISCWDFTYHI